jgi:hypothetical protein
VIIAAACALNPLPAVQGQNITEFGAPTELKGVTKIHVTLIYGGSVELKDRERIIKEIESGKKKHKIENLEIVERPEDAEVILIYSEVIEGYGAGATTTRSGETAHTTIREIDEWIGKGIVVKQLSNGKQRLIMDSTSSQVFLWEKTPATSFGRAFMKAYLKANNSEVTAKGLSRRWNPHKQRAKCEKCSQENLPEFSDRQLQKVSKFACFCRPNCRHPSLLSNKLDSSKKK